MRNPLAALFVLLAACSFATAQPVAGNEPSLTVHGQGRFESRPDYARLTATVVSGGETLEAATAAHRERAQRAANALRELKAQGIEIERSTFRLDEDRLLLPRPSPGRGRDEPEFRAVTSFELKSEQIDKVDAAISAIAGTGLFELRNLRYGIGDKNPGIEAARRAAVADARRRAQSYAEAAGIKLGGILRMQESAYSGSREMGAPGAPMSRASVQVAPPEALSLTAQVTMTWLIDVGP